MFTVRLIPCGTNCFLIKKKPVWMIKKVSACLHLLGVSSPSTAPVWGSACSSNCGRFGRAGFVQSCSTPSGGNTEESNQAAGDKCWLSELEDMSIALYCIALFSCVVFLQWQWCVFVFMSDDGGQYEGLHCVYLSHYTTMHVLHVPEFVYGQHWQKIYVARMHSCSSGLRLCGFDTMFETVCMKCKCL